MIKIKLNLEANNAFVKNFTRWKTCSIIQNLLKFMQTYM